MTILNEIPEVRDANYIYKLDKELGCLVYFFKDLYKYLSKQDENNVYIFLHKCDIMRRMRLYHKVMNLSKILST